MGGRSDSLIQPSDIDALREVAEYLAGQGDGDFENPETTMARTVHEIADRWALLGFLVEETRGANTEETT